MAQPKLNRRQFIKLAGLTGALGIPSLMGYSLYRAGEGEVPESSSPYPAEQFESLPAAGAPILVMLPEDKSNPFGAYLVEILRAEGLNCFQVATLNAINSTLLEQFKLILLAQGSVHKAQAQLLEAYVARGGRLIAMCPDTQLSTLFGVERLTSNTSEGYLQVAADQLIGQGIAQATLQFHGTADHYRLTGAQAVAWLASDSQSISEFPAVTFYNYNQGQAALWAFDLARSVVYTRQGNPAWAGQERDGREGIRAHDAFVGWIDLDRIAIPQADEQMRLLTQLIHFMLAEVIPLPRLWYFPDAAPGVLIPTGDWHDTITAPIEDVLSLIEARGGHMSMYYSPPLRSTWRRALQRARWWVADLPFLANSQPHEFQLPTPASVTAWRMRGHEFAFHPYVEEGVEYGYRRYWQEFTGLGYGAVAPTVRTHRVLWQDWVETARVQAAYRFGMNLDYYHVGPAFQKQDGAWAYGYFTGSGLPMQFMDEQGRLLKVFQQLTPLVDEHLLRVVWGANGWVKLDTEAAVDVSRNLLRRTTEGVYAAIAAQFHIDAFNNNEFAPQATRWLEGTLDSAVELGLPIWTAERWLHFTQARHDAIFEAIEWQPQAKRLNFQLTIQPLQEAELTVMVPINHGKAKLAQVEVNQQTVSFKQQTVAGLSYGWVSVQAGSHQVVATYA